MSRAHIARYLLIAALLPALVVLSPIAFGLVAIMVGTMGLLLGVFGAALGSAAALIGLMLVFLASCASPVAPPSVKKPVTTPKVDTGLDRMERLALTANRCWFKSRDPAFTGYSLAPELSSFSGRPRFLLVPKGRLEARPLLVVEGRAGSADVEAYGPLLDTSMRARLEGDLTRWKAGSGECSA